MFFESVMDLDPEVSGGLDGGLHLVFEGGEPQGEDLYAHAT